MNVTNGTIAAASVIAIVAVLALAGFAFATWGSGDAEVIDPPARFNFSLDGDVVTLQGDPVDGVGVSGTSTMSFMLATQGTYLGFVYNNIWIYDEGTGTIVDTISSSTSMQLDMYTLAVSGAEHLGTETIDVVLDGESQKKTCEVYKVVREDTGDVFTVYISVEDLAVYSMDYQAKRFLPQGEGSEIPVSVSGSATLTNGFRNTTTGYTDDPSVGTSTVFLMGGTGTLTTPEGTVEVGCGGTITQTVLSVGSKEDYGQPITYYLLGVDCASDDGTTTFESSCLLGITGTGIPEGGQLYQRHVDVNGTPCTLWTLMYNNYDMVNIDEMTAYDWALYITVAIAEDGSGDVISYSTDDRTVSYTLDETGKHTMVLDKVCSLNTVF